jgi:hypothetical protein
MSDPKRKEFIKNCKAAIFVVDKKTSNVLHSIMYETESEDMNHLTSRISDFMTEIFTQKKFAVVRKEFKKNTVTIMVPDEEGLQDFIQHLVESEDADIEIHDPDAEKLFRKIYGK